MSIILFSKTLWVMCTNDFGESKNRKSYVFNRWGKDKRGRVRVLPGDTPMLAKVLGTCLFIPVGDTLSSNRCIPTPETQRLQDKNHLKKLFIYLVALCLPWLWWGGLLFVAVQGLRCSATRWNLPGPGVKQVSAALANEFLSTLPPGNPG